MNVLNRKVKLARSFCDVPSQGLLVIFNKRFREDLKWWYRKDKAKAEKILDLIESATEDPFKGLGKPEPLKYIGSGVWSRRITAEHRLVYRVNDLAEIRFAVRFIEFLQARYHY